MEIQKACIHILTQLSELIDRLQEGELVQPSESLSGSTLGQHLRHTLEFFICFEKGYTHGVINYDKRAHDRTIERSKAVALQTIQRITDFVRVVEERDLTLEVAYDMTCTDFIAISTTASRELIYNIEHAVHHMAIMKIGMREITPHIILSKDFGVAASTLRCQENSVHPAH